MKINNTNSMPVCKGTNCGCTDGWSHSTECKAELEEACSPGEMYNESSVPVLTEIIPEIVDEPRMAGCTPGDQTIGYFAAEISRLRYELRKRSAAPTGSGQSAERCETCNSELSPCGVQDDDGEPTLDCRVCLLRARADAAEAKLAAFETTAKAAGKVMQGYLTDIAEARAISRGLADKLAAAQARTRAGMEARAEMKEACDKLLAASEAREKRLREALEAIAKYDQNSDNGICPYGCDSPHIARATLAAGEVGG